jgi:drug/metabolite transporter (DMT)-like permease
MHGVGVACGIAAGAWLGSAEAPIKLVSAGYSPVVISLCMVAGVFVARWTLPVLMKGTAYVFRDTAARPHLVVWAVLAGALWAIANTLTVIAVRNVGLSIAFPLWNTNSLIGTFWGWLLFGELRGGGAKNGLKVVGGTLVILVATIMLAYASLQTGGGHATHASAGILAAFGASVLWGTMYIPYRKAYLSGMNPLSFVTIFTVGELGTMAVLALTMSGGAAGISKQIAALRPAVFWLFLGGFCWVIGDLFQQFATKYIGISRGIPLSNTNQLWGLAWGALVFGELSGAGRGGQLEVVAGSLLMALGALLIGSATAPAAEQAYAQAAADREQHRYSLEAAPVGDDMRAPQRSWWDVLIVVAGVLIFVWLGSTAQRPLIELSTEWILVLSAAVVLLLAGSGWMLWRRTRFT